MDSDKMLILLATLTLLLVVLDTVASYPTDETNSESQQPRISQLKKDRRHHRHRSPASRHSASSAEFIPDDESVALDVANNLPSSDENVDSAEERSSGVLNRRRRRHRRSVTWWLQAAIRMCDESRTNRGGRGCKEVNVNNGRLRVHVTLQDE